MCAFAEKLVSFSWGLFLSSILLTVGYLICFNLLKSFGGMQ